MLSSGLAVGRTAKYRLKAHVVPCNFFKERVGAGKILVLQADISCPFDMHS